MLKHQHILLPKDLVGLVGACTHLTHSSAWFRHQLIVKNDPTVRVEISEL